jgi:hypothetical protein
MLTSLSIRCPVWVWLLDISGPGAGYPDLPSARQPEASVNMFPLLHSRNDRRRRSAHAQHAGRQGTFQERAELSPDTELDFEYLNLTRGTCTGTTAVAR